MIINGRYYKLNLQLFATAEDEGRTEEPTPKRLREEREKGRVARTPELASALVMFAGFITIAIMAKYIFTGLFSFTQHTLESCAQVVIDSESYKIIFGKIALKLIKFLLPVMVVCVVVAFLSDVFQVGFLFSVHPLIPRFDKISFTFNKLVTRIFFSRQVAANLLRTLIKTTIIGLVIFFIIKSDIPKFTTLIWDSNLYNSIAFIASVTIKIIIWVSILFLVLAILDYFYQRYEYIQSLKMTPREWKEERKQLEGDPYIKARQREIHRELVRRRMMQEVPKADVVITNPTHYAVALLYDRSYMLAPTVIAKGAGFIALKIIEIAKQHGVYIVQNPPLAQTLYKEVEIGDEIPENLFTIVAEILAVVYKIKKKAA